MKFSTKMIWWVMNFFESTLYLTFLVTLESTRWWKMMWSLFIHCVSNERWSFARGKYLLVSKHECFYMKNWKGFWVVMKYKIFWEWDDFSKTCINLIKLAKKFETDKKNLKLVQNFLSWYNFKNFIIFLLSLQIFFRFKNLQ